jgi:hypothetical protein
MIVEAFGELYAKGYTVAEIAATTSVDRNVVNSILDALGVSRRSPGRRKGTRIKNRKPLFMVNKDRNYLASIDRQHNVCMVHRACWEACHGPIPRGYAIHHRDGNRLNNAPENLECLSWSQHIRLHIAQKKTQLQA